MFLRSIELRHVRSIERLRLSFLTEDGLPRPWTLILGDNGAGKSTILRSIALLTAGSDALPEILGNPESWIRSGHNECIIRGELQTATGEIRQASITLRRNDTLLSIVERNRDTLEQLNAALGHSNRNYLTIGYGVSRRPAGVGRGISGPDSETFRHPRARSVATLFSQQAMLHPLDVWAMNLHYSYKSKGVEVVRKTLAEFLPHVQFKRIDTRSRKLIFETPDGEVPFEQLSDGYQNVAAWCGDLVYRISEIFRDHSDPLNARGVLLIDEIDLHLHPSWQRQLHDFLSHKLPHMQVVATTHSPLTAQQVGRGSLFFLRRERPRSAARLTAYSGDPSRLMVHQILTSPLFGLETMDSRRIERARIRYRKLSTRKRLTAAERTELLQVRQELADAPDWHRNTQSELRQTELLAQIERLLSRS